MAKTSVKEHSLKSSKITFSSRFCGSGKAVIPCLLAALFVLLPAFLSASEAYSTLKKFLSARMYGEAYNELLRQELANDTFDPKLEKLRKDLLERTKERLTKQARINPDDPAIFIILADISFHQGNLEDASAQITKALGNKSGPMANYIFAKILFRKGNLPQAFDQMGTVLENMPDSPVVFEDFQFLYACKSYGIATAKKISKNSNFVRRATPVAGDDNLPKIPDSPFENDPTVAVVQPVDSPASDTAQLENLDGAQISDSGSSPLPDEVDPLESPDDIEDPGQDPPTDVDNGDDTTVVPRPTPDGFKPLTVQVQAPVSEEDPEKEKIQKAEYWLKQAQKQFENRNYDNADMNWKKATELYPTLPEKEDLRAKIDSKFALIKSFREAKELFEQEKFEQALPGLEAAYGEEPERFRDAPLMIGKIYLLRTEPDYVNALKFFDIVLQDKDLDPLVKRDIDWTRMEIFYDTERYEEASVLFEQFLSKEEAFTKGQVNYNQLRYGIWYKLHKLWIHIGLGIFALLFIIVFVLKLLPAVSFSLAAPLVSAKKAFENRSFEKTVSIIEKAMLKKQPVQIEREMLELLVQSHFELKNFVRCQENARLLLEKFPTSNVAWGFLAKASMASHDTSNEAIAMYEAIYKENPGKTEYLPVLARHYSETRNYTVEAMSLLFTYYQTGSKEPPIVMALANGYVQNRTMGNEVITVLEEALKIKDKIEFRELLARNYAKSNRYSDAARECTKVLSENINNMGIHVVYTSSMKKLKMLEEAIAQYKDFLHRYPGNEQLLEIIAGLKKDASDLSSIHDDGLPSIPDELPMPDLPEPGFHSNLSSGEIDIDNFIEPPPEGFDMDESTDIPLPDFLKDSTAASAAPPPRPAPKKPTPPAIPVKARPVELPTLDPFEESDSLLDEFAGDLPEELGGPSSSGTINDFASKNAITSDDLLTDFPEDIAPIPEVKQREKSAKTAADSQAKMSQAREKAQRKKWDEVIELLSPLFASERNRDMGLLLADAWLQKNKATMSMEIIETLDFDPEIMNDSIKDILYRTGLALEHEKKLDEALRMYDMICNADINYRDAFERSDKIYGRKS